MVRSTTARGASSRKYGSCRMAIRRARSILALAGNKGSPGKLCCRSTEPSGRPCSQVPYVVNVKKYAKGSPTCVSNQHPRAGSVSDGSRWDPSLTLPAHYFARVVYATESLRSVAYASGSSSRFVPALAQNRSNQFQLIRHGAQRAAQSARHFRMADAFHFPNRELSQLVVTQGVEERFQLVLHYGDEFGRRLRGSEIIQRARAHSLAASTALPGVLRVQRVGDFLPGDEDEQPPEVVPVAELGEAAGPHAAPKAQESAIGNGVAIMHPGR